MRVTVAQLRRMIHDQLMQEALPGKSGQYVRRQDVYDHVEYDPPSKSFKDRWGNPIRGPETLDPKALRAWLDGNRVETVTVHGRRMSPKIFADRLAPTLKKGTVVPIVKGKPEIGPLGQHDTMLSKTMIRPGV